MIDPVSIPHFGGLQAPSDKLCSTKQVLPGGNAPWDQTIQLNDTKLARASGRPTENHGWSMLMLLMKFYRLPNKPIYDTRPFYRGNLRTDQDSCAAIWKMFGPLDIPNIRVPQAPRQKQVLLGGYGSLGPGDYILKSKVGDHSRG